MPMNNGNVRRSAVGVAEGTFDANFNANVSPAVLGMFSGGKRGQDRGRQAGRQAGRGRQGQTKSPRREAGGRERGRRLMGDGVGPPRNPHLAKAGKGVGSHPNLFPGIAGETSRRLFRAAGFNRQERRDLLPGQGFAAVGGMVTQNPGGLLAAHSRGGLRAQVETPLVGNHLAGNVPLPPRQGRRFELRGVRPLAVTFTADSSGVPCAHPAHRSNGFENRFPRVAGFPRPGIGDGKDAHRH